MDVNSFVFFRHSFFSVSGITHFVLAVCCMYYREKQNKIKNPIQFNPSEILTLPEAFFAF